MRALSPSAPPAPSSSSSPPVSSPSELSPSSPAAASTSSSLPPPLPACSGSFQHPAAAAASRTKTMEALECPVCMEDFDQDQHRPKVVPCGHTLCLGCLLGLRVLCCPTCRKEIKVAVTSLPDNLVLVRMIDDQSSRADKRELWCSDCNAVATDQCLDEHSLLGAKAALRRRVQDAVRLAEGLAPGLAEGLRGCGDEQALAALKLLRAEAAGCSLSLAVGDAVFKARWQPAAAGGGGEPVGDPLLQVLVAAMAARGGLWEDQDDDEDVEEDKAMANLKANTELLRAELLEEMDFELDADTVLRAAATAAAVRAAYTADHPDDNQAVHDEGQEAGGPPPLQADGEGERVVEGQLYAEWDVVVPEEVTPLEDLDVGSLSSAYFTGFTAQRRKEKIALLQQVRSQGALKLRNVRCDRDPDWTLELLRCAAPTLKELQLTFTRPRHLLLAVTANGGMPRLRRLDIHCSRALEERPCELQSPEATAAASPGEDNQPRRRLRSLSVQNMHHDTLESLLRACASSLRVLRLAVGTPVPALQQGTRQMPWLPHNADLDELLRRCGLRALRDLVLWRAWPNGHTPSLCADQLAALRRVFPPPRTVVLCTICHNVG